MSQFTEVPVMGIPTNSFDLSYRHNLTLNAGYLVPVSVEEVLPKDTHNYHNKTFLRLAPMVSPPMAEIDITMMTFFVPLRLLWPNYEKFFANPVPDENTPVPPYLANINVGVGSLGDYLELPTSTYRSDTGSTVQQYSSIEEVSAFPFAAYQKIYNDWFRDENLVNNGEETFKPLTDGNNPLGTLGSIRKRAWRHDYFTSNLPFAQKGDAVEVPLGTFAPVVRNPEPHNSALVRHTFNGALSPAATLSSDGAGVLITNGTGSFIDPNDSLIADLSNASAVTINTLRWATKLQEFLEKNARGGTRYTEIVRQHFGQRSSDARLQRAEFLGFSVNPVIISEVLQTSESQSDSTPLGEMAGHGLSYGSSKHVNYHAEEHGIIMTVASIRPKSSYMQGLSRMWTRKSPLDFAWPTFAQLGEQETKSKELFYTGDPEIDERTFGYLPRYAEYRYHQDRQSGEMRTSMTHWHMGRIFDEPPVLNQNFIECNPTQRIFAVNTPGVHSYIMSVHNKHKVRRALPKYGIPAL